jgi:hypothetical protein
MEVDNHLLLLFLCGFPWETHMSPGRGSHVTDGKPHIVIRSR